ncbi:MAG: glycoside hydrolase family 20 zincin-like fold domain-containing protein, partial [Ginsengibacter sp.]
MNKKLFLLSLLLLPFFVIAQQTVSIIPQPVSLSVQDGHFTIDKSTSIIFKNEKDLFLAANFFNAFLKNISGEALSYNVKKTKSFFLDIKKTDKIGSEGYLLDVTPYSIKIIANDKAGIIYGMQSIFQTLPQIRTNAALEVPC